MDITFPFLLLLFFRFFILVAVFFFFIFFNFTSVVSKLFATRFEAKATHHSPSSIHNFLFYFILFSYAYMRFIYICVYYMNKIHRVLIIPQFHLLTTSLLIHISLYDTTCLHICISHVSKIRFFSNSECNEVVIK